MASTNKTTHYDLSQYVSSDKPTYLVDYNGDMAKIDTGINAAKTTADSASTAATNAASDAANAQSTANTAVTNAATAQTTADGANTKIGTLANLTTVVKTDLVSAINEVNAKDPVVNTLSGGETDKAPSVSAVNTELSNFITTVTSGNVKAYKFADGTLIVNGYSPSYNVNANSGGAHTFDSPVAFTGTNYVVTTNIRETGAYWASCTIAGKVVDNDTIDIEIWNNGEGTATLSVEFIAIGKWK